MDNTRYYVKLPDGSFVSFDNVYEFAMFNGSGGGLSHILTIIAISSVVMLGFSFLLWLVCFICGQFV